MLAKQIVYRELKSPLGKLVGGATPSGCCFLEFKDRFDIKRTNPQIEKWHGLEMMPGSNEYLDQLEYELKQYFSGDLQEFSIPLDLKGTPFQLLVWEQLRDVPYGEIRSYSEIARLVKKPLAVRAIGRANGANPLAIVIPCHRIIRSDGKLGGYGGGLWRKKRLLTLEGHNMFSSQSRLEKWF